LLTGCQRKETVQSTVVEVDTTKAVEKKPVQVVQEIKKPVIPPDSSFQIFYARFQSDTAFQLERTRFPFQVLTWGPADEDPVGSRIEMSDWEHLTLPPFEDHPFNNEYSVRISFETETASAVIYTFQNEDGHWMLDKREQYNKE